MKDFSGNRLCDYPVGAIIGFANDVNPNNYYPNTTWEQIKDRFLLAGGSQYALGQTGGEATHTLTLDEVVQQDMWISNTAYNPGIKSAVDPGSYYGINTRNNSKTQPHNNMPPYVVVNYWKRTA